VTPHLSLQESGPTVVRKCVACGLKKAQRAKFMFRELIATKRLDEYPRLKKVV